MLQGKILKDFFVGSFANQRYPRIGRVKQYPWFVPVCMQAAVWPGAIVSGQMHRLGNF